LHNQSDKSAATSRHGWLFEWQTETLLLLVTGLSNKEIAAARDRAEVT